MRFSSALSTESNTRQAAAMACQQAMERLGQPADLAWVFASPHHRPAFDELAAELAERTHARCMLGCTGESIVGTGQEIEEQPALSLWLAHLPDVSLTPLELEFQRTPEGGSIVGWPDDLMGAWPEGSALFLMGEPFSFPADLLLQRMNDDRPGVPVLGGMASGGYSPGENRLLLNGRVVQQGAVGVLMHGKVRVRSVVSQGCRPIGRHFVITRAEQNVIHEMGGKPPLAQLQEVFDELPPHDQELVQKGLHVGAVINEYQQDKFGRGDFLVRNVVGADRNTGAIAIGDFARVGQTVQFHVRDAQTADEDLRELLGAVSDADNRAALLFTCNGRGTRLFSEPHHDAGTVRQVLGDIPVAGLFAQGEMGPVGGKNFLHGFTASVAIFGPADQ